MSDSVFGLLELLLVFGLVLGGAIRELLLLRREARKAKRDASPE
jgi:hypothetical protein